MSADARLPPDRPGFAAGIAIPPATLPLEHLMARGFDRWCLCNPRAMATKQSIAAIEHAFADAKHDVLALHAIAGELLAAVRSLTVKGTTQASGIGWNARVRQAQAIADRAEGIKR